MGNASGMPTIQGSPGPFRFRFFSMDCREPPHVHVIGTRGACKFWLDPVSVAEVHGVGAAELRMARRTILEYRLVMLEAWNEHCRKS